MAMSDNLILSKINVDIGNFNEMMEDVLRESQRGNRGSDCTG